MDRRGRNSAFGGMSMWLFLDQDILEIGVERRKATLENFW